jgi:hypothetical protein
VTVGDSITPAQRRSITATIAAVSGDTSEAGAHLARARLDVLAPRGAVTAELLLFLARAQALLEPRCPRCLDASIGLCPPCRPIHAKEVDMSVRVRDRRAHPDQLLAIAALPELTDPPATAAPEPAEAPQVLLDQIDRADLARSCAGKGWHASEVDAKRVARECEAKRGKPLRVYHCWPGCGGWHLTSRLEVPEYVRAREAR